MTRSKEQKRKWLVALLLFPVLVVIWLGQLGGEGEGRRELSANEPEPALPEGRSMFHRMMCALRSRSSWFGEIWTHSPL